MRPVPISECAPAIVPPASVARARSGCSTSSILPSDCESTAPGHSGRHPHQTARARVASGGPSGCGISPSRYTRTPLQVSAVQSDKVQPGSRKPPACSERMQFSALLRADCPAMFRGRCGPFDNTHKRVPDCRWSVRPRPSETPPGKKASAIPSLALDQAPIGSVRAPQRHRSCVAQCAPAATLPALPCSASTMC